MSYRFTQNRMPPGVLNLIILNVIIFITNYLFNANDIAYQTTGYSAFENKLCLHHPFSEDFHFYQYITSMFMHGSVSHILFNMFGLWIFGSMLENVWGTKRFVIFYLICGLGASFIYQVWDSIDWIRMLHSRYENQLPAGAGFFDLLHTYPPQGVLLGASGAIFGVLAGAAMLFPNTPMYMMFIPIPIKLKWLAIGYGAIEVYNSLQLPGDHVAHFAHVGGMIFGFILVKIYNRSKNHFY